MTRSAEATALCYFRKIWLMLAQKKPAAVRGTFSVQVANYLLNRKRTDLANLERQYDASIVIEASTALHPHEGHLEFTPREVPQV